MNSSSENVDSPSEADVSAGHQRISLLKLAWYFFWIALTTVQGAAGHMRRQLVNKRKLVTEKEFYESFGLAEFLPQPDSTFGLAVHVGYRVRGVDGALVVAFTMLLPALFLMSILGIAYLRFHHLDWVEAATAGAATGCCAIVGGTLLEVGRKAIKDFRDLIVILLVFVLLRYVHLHIAGVLLWVTPLALWIHRPSRHEHLPKVSWEPPGLVPTLGFRHRLRSMLAGFFSEGRWGSAATAAFLVAVMFLISVAEHRGPELLARVKTTVQSESHHEAPAVCPVLPLSHLSDSLEDQNSGLAQLGAVCTDLISSFSALSFCAFGGEETILPCMKNASVVHHAWMSQREFVDLFSMSYLVPGPSMLSALVGLKACSSYGLGGKLLGASVAILALFLPSIVVVLLVAHYWSRLAEWKWRPTIGRSMLLIAAGALSAALMFITETAITSSITAAIAAGSVLALILTDINPVLVVILSAVAGLLFLG